MLGLLMVMLCVTGCASTPASDAALCAGTADSRRALADALLTDGGDQSQRAGLVMLDKVQAGCR